MVLVVGLRVRVHAVLRVGAVMRARDVVVMVSSRCRRRRRPYRRSCRGELDGFADGTDLVASGLRWRGRVEASGLAEWCLLS